jgi:hypothetical protein
MKTIADPACGTGGFFLGAYNWLTRPGAKLDKRQKEFLRDARPFTATRSCRARAACA